MMECQLEVVFYVIDSDGEKVETTTGTFFDYDTDKAYCDGMTFDDIADDMVNKGLDRVKSAIPEEATDFFCRLMLPVNPAYIVAYLKD
jgi:hypothetical protein